jgi:hypothetical protein
LALAWLARTAARRRWAIAPVSRPTEKNTIPRRPSETTPISVPSMRAPATNSPSAISAAAAPARAPSSSAMIAIGRT